MGTRGASPSTTRARGPGETTRRRGSSHIPGAGRWTAGSRHPPRSVQFRTEIGSLPHRDRFDGGAVTSGSSARPANPHRTRRREARRKVPRCPMPRAPLMQPLVVVPSRARSYLLAPGRTRLGAVVPSRSWSYGSRVLRYDRGSLHTTARPRVRPHKTRTRIAPPMGAYSWCVGVYESEDSCDGYREGAQWSSAAGVQDAPGPGCSR